MLFDDVLTAFLFHFVERPIKFMKNVYTSDQFFFHSDSTLFSFSTFIFYSIKLASKVMLYLPVGSTAALPNLMLVEHLFIGTFFLHPLTPCCHRVPKLYFYTACVVEENLLELCTLAESQRSSILDHAR